MCRDLGGLAYANRGPGGVETPVALARGSLKTIILLEIGINYVLAAANSPLDDLHATESAGEVALLAAL